MTTNITAVPPPVLWAQRSDVVYLTFVVEVKEPTIKIETDSLYFKGNSCADKKLYELTIPFYTKIDPEKSAYDVKGRCVEVILSKANKEEPFWPSLTNDKKKHHWLKVDFNKWQDEDEENSANDLGNGTDLEEMLKSMGGVGAMGGDKQTLDDLGDDSDDEELPDLE